MSARRVSKDQRKPSYLAHGQHLREETIKTDNEATELQKGADRLDKKADDERDSRKEREIIIAATKERVTEVEKKLQKIRVELEI
jgi:valyl-tRNA synthetase